MRRAGRVDANQREIVQLLRALGCHVWVTSGFGQGAPDLCVSRRFHTAYVELKDGSRPPSERQLTADELDWQRDCDGKARYVVVESTDDAIALALSLGAEEY